MSHANVITLLAIGICLKEKKKRNTSISQLSRKSVMLASAASICDRNKIYLNKNNFPIKQIP